MKLWTSIGMVVKLKAGSRQMGSGQTGQWPGRIHHPRLLLHLPICLLPTCLLWQMGQWLGTLEGPNRLGSLASL